jgi:hypothetical protein
VFDGRDMLHGHRIPRQEIGTDRDRPRLRNNAANLGHQLISRQDGRASGGTRRKDVEELEESSLRKAKGKSGREINPIEQAMARRFLNRNGVQTEQDKGVKSRGLSLTEGSLWQR